MFAEIQFLTNYLPLQRRDRVVVVYAGAANGEHIPALYHLFDFIEFHLYDKSGFSLRLVDFAKGKKIFIHHDFFTDETAEFWRKQNNQDDTYIFFISDIRTFAYHTREKNGKPIALTLEQSAANDKHIVDDMNAQKRWVNIMRPEQSLLKFRLTYPKDNKETFNYFNGTVYRQAWGPLSTTECRLVPGNGLFDWNLKYHESVMAYHNMVTRSSQFFNPVDGSTEPCSSLLDLRYDSSLTSLILRNYLSKFGRKATNTEVRNLFEAIVKDV